MAFLLAAFAISPAHAQRTLTERLEWIERSQKARGERYHIPTAEDSKPQSIAEIGLTGEWRWYPSGGFPYAIRVTAIEPGSVLDRARDPRHPDRRIMPGDYLRLTREVAPTDRWSSPTYYTSMNFPGVYFLLAHLTTYDFKNRSGQKVYFRISRFRNAMLAENAKVDSDVEFFSSEFQFDLDMKPELLQRLKNVAAGLPKDITLDSFTQRYPWDFEKSKWITRGSEINVSNYSRTPIDITAALLGIAAATVVITLSTEQGERTGICNKRTSPVWLAVARERYNVFVNPGVVPPTLEVETNIKLEPGACYKRKVEDDYNLWYAFYELKSQGVVPLVFQAGAKGGIDYAKERPISHLCVNPNAAVWSTLSSYQYAGDGCPKGSLPVPTSFGFRGAANTTQTVNLL